MDQKIEDSQSQFLKIDSGKTKSNSIEIPSISLPKGGGALKGIDEKFSVNAINGTASLSIPLPVSPARGLSPALTLSYNSGGGNGIFGLGWVLGLSSIKRKTDRALPKYFDRIDSDTYLFSEAEDLVPEYQKDPNGIFKKDANDRYMIKESLDASQQYTIRYYRPRIEGLFARIERWYDKQSGEIKWKVTTKENVTTLFGWTAQSRTADPQDSRRIFEWLPEFVFDDKGNSTHYLYKKEDESGFDATLLHNRNRKKEGKLTYTNTYLEKVLYGNKTPYKNLLDAFPSENDYLFQTVLDYGEYNTDAPYDKINPWDTRKDAFSHYRAGFEIRTTRLCKRVLLYHYFEELPNGSALVKSLNFEYNKSIEEGFSFLTSITSYGYIKQNNGTYTQKSLPPMIFDYQKHMWNKEVQSITTDDLVHAPTGITAPYQFADLFNEGLSGILTEQANGWHYKHNLGQGKFSQAKPVSPKPSFVGLGAQLQLADLDADGTKQISTLNTQPKGFFELSDEEEWQPFKHFKHIPNIDMNDPNTRMIDLNGNGKPDLLISEDNVFVWYESLGRRGFSQAQKTPHSFDEEESACIIFSDSTQSIFLADMSGDGLTDIVRIRNGEVCYWPNLGYGKFDSKVGMDNAPLFDHPDAYNPSYIRIADIDGSGTPDIIYLGRNTFRCWMNLSGNAFSQEPFEIDAFPDIDNQANITVADLLGNGVACIVWSSALSKDAQQPLRYIDLMHSKKPHVMIGYQNNLGKEVHFTYVPSTKFYLEDKKRGEPWVTKLHFPVHCVEKTETLDKTSGHRFVSSYSYHHGYYDHTEREFRGFGRVEQLDSEHFEHFAKTDANNLTDETLHQAPVLTKSWFHTGAFETQERLLKQYEHEYWHEFLKKEGFNVNHKEVPLPKSHIILAPALDVSLLDNLSIDELREASRACKSMGLRSEIFSDDTPDDTTPQARKKALTPYSVATHNCVIELLQPKGENRHAVYIVKESESIVYSYEREVEDPRVAHNINTKLDPYGNVLEAASIIYPRQKHDASLPTATKKAQKEMLVSYVQNYFTNDIINDTTYRLRLPSEIKTYALKGMVPTGDYFTLSDFDDVLNRANEVGYEELESIPTQGQVQKRLIEHLRTTYLKNDLQTPLALHKLEGLGLPYESYQLAYTPALLNDIFSPKVDIDTTLMVEGKFTHNEGDTNWWIRSGSTQFLEAGEQQSDAQARFYLPLSYTDPYGAITRVHYFNDYFLWVEETADALDNRSKVEAFNFFTLSPQRMKDINDNISEVLFDELGLVKAVAVMGKGDEADDLENLTAFSAATEERLVTSFFTATNSSTLVTHAKTLLQHATARFVYDFDAYQNSGKPAVVASIVREEHFKVNAHADVQLSFEYSSGLGEVLMQKVQAEPGEAKKVTVSADGSYTVSSVNTGTQLRWIGNGRTILNNKGNPVKQYEPYFSVTHVFEEQKELVESGVTPILYYDAMGRNIKTELPDGTFIKTEFDAWKQSSYDANDTVLDSSWYAERMALPNGNQEKEAAKKAEAHANTPAVQHFDTLGRAVLSIEHNRDDTGIDLFYHTSVTLDDEGNLRKVTDARGNVVMSYKYDLLGNMVYQESMDAGKRWLLTNILGNPLRTWDERNHEFTYFYDILHRPTHSKVLGGDGTSALDHIFEFVVYGESETNAKAKNLRGQVLEHYDTGGLLSSPAYDFKGQPTATHRKLFKDYKSVANWTSQNRMQALETELYTFTTKTDALGRISKQTAPDGSVITPTYNQAGVLESEHVAHSVIGNTLAMGKEYIKDINYNEKGQRTKIVYGNDVETTYHYDPTNFRLIHLQSKKGTKLLQDLYYTYDAVGNITHIEDKSHSTAFYDNQQVDPSSTYTYDALYRLIEATGRENKVTPAFGEKDNWNDVEFIKPNNPIALRNYRQSYSYDEVGNITQMKHLATNASWTRDYAYETHNNRLKNTQVGTEIYTYPHHTKHGYIKSMPHLQEMDWNFKEELVKTIRQKRNNGTPETTYYQYDSSGQRIRKITENQADAGVTPTRKEERIYIAGFEVYKKYSGTHAGLERTSLSLMDEDHRFVMVERRNDIDDGTKSSLIRYQMHNHLDSCALELDDLARIISYEEYHPYGTTAYQAMNKTIKASAKRYRYTGMERDEESGLSYHSARYYLPWLGRWLSGDPIGIGDGVNVYRYSKNNSIVYYDLNGQQVKTFDKNREREKLHKTQKERTSDSINRGAYNKVKKSLTTDIRSLKNKLSDKQKLQANKLMHQMLMNEKNLAKNADSLFSFLHTSKDLDLGKITNSLTSYTSEEIHKTPSKNTQLQIAKLINLFIKISILNLVLTKENVDEDEVLGNAWKIAQAMRIDIDDEPESLVSAEHYLVARGYFKTKHTLFNVLIKQGAAPLMIITIYSYDMFKNLGGDNLVQLDKNHPSPPWVYGRAWKVLGAIHGSLRSNQVNYTLKVENKEKNSIPWVGSGFGISDETKAKFIENLNK